MRQRVMAALAYVLDGAYVYAHTPAGIGKPVHAGVSGDQRRFLAA